MECKGFLFDLDGTLVDSLPAVERAWIGWAQSRGINPVEVLDFIHGKQAITSLRHFMQGASDAELQAEFLALEHIEANDTDGVTALPGAVALLNRLNSLSILGDCDLRFGASGLSAPCCGPFAGTQSVCDRRASEARETYA